MAERYGKPGAKKGQPKPLKRVLDAEFPARLLEAIGSRDKVPETAARVGCSRAVLSHYLNGKNRQIEALLLFALADALDVSAKWLATGVGAKRGLVRDEARLLAAYREAHEDEKEIIRRLLDRFSGEQRE